MKDHSRRSFVKTSAATGLTFTFAGLIRAHGQSGGGTTWNQEATFGTTWATDVSTTWNQEATYVATTWPGYETSTTYDPNGSYIETTNPYQEYTTTCDPNVYETTQAETEIATTHQTTEAVYKYALKCIATPYTMLGSAVTFDSVTRRYQLADVTTYDPDGPRDVGLLRLNMIAYGPFLGQITTTMSCSVNASVTVIEETATQSDQVIIGGAGAVTDECLVQIDEDTGLVTVQPNAPMQKHADGGNADVYAMATAAFDCFAYGNYHEDSWLPGNVTIPLPKGLEFEVEQSSETYGVGPLQLSWTVIVVRKKLPGGSWETAPADMQPAWLQSL